MILQLFLFHCQFGKTMHRKYKVEASYLTEEEKDIFKKKKRVLCRY